MQRDTFVVKQYFLQWLHKRSNPGLIVNLCFLVVLAFSTLLTWREVVVLEEAYISSQRNHLETVATSLDRQLQYSVDKMLFFRTSMHDALQTPWGLMSCAMRCLVLAPCGRMKPGSWPLIKNAPFPERRVRCLRCKVHAP